MVIMNKKILFIGYQITNLIFQLFLIPFLYHSIELTDIGEIVLLSSISQVLINFISSGASILGVSRYKEVNTSSIFMTQMMLSLAVSTIFFCVMFFSEVELYLTGVFSLYVLSSGFSLYWNYIFHQRYGYLFIGNVVAKLVFFVFILSVEVNKLYYSVAICIEYVSLLIFFLFFESEVIFGWSVSKKILKNYIISSVNRVLGYASLQMDKIIISSVFGAESLAVYNFIYKLIDVPTNLLIQFNYIFMSKAKGIKALPWLFVLSSSISLCLIFVFSSVISLYLTDNKILISHYYLEIALLSALITIRPLNEYISFVKYYHVGNYLLPGLCAIISVLPYFVFYFIDVDIIFFYMMVTVCALISLLVINRTIKDILREVICMAILLIISLLVMINLNYVAITSFAFVLIIAMCYILYKVMFSYE